jgi:Skp family chaperone for outer membrane proteins
MPMPRRDKNPLNELRAELEQVRKDATKSRKDIVALKARLVDAEQRLAKAETALGTIGKSGATPEVEPVIAEDAMGDETQQPETE